VVHLEQGGPVETTVELTSGEERFEIELPSPPLRLDIDPRFELFRTLYSEESPPTLGALFGSERGLILLPSAAPDRMAEQYRALAERWSRGYDDWEIRRDDQIERLPEDRPVWLLGWENRFRGRFAENPEHVQVGGERFARTGHSVVLVTPGSSPEAPPTAWLGAHSPKAVPGLARKLPHYGKYGWLVFSGEAPDNIRKGQWPVGFSPLSVVLVDKPVTRHLAPAPALSDALD